MQLAQIFGPDITATQLINNAKGAILRPLVLLLFAAALVYFLYGVIEFLTAPGDETRKTKGKLHMFWGVLGLAIMISVYGIMNILCNTVGCA